MQSKGQVEPDEDVLDDAVAFAGVSKYPARVKCALLAWMAWKDARIRPPRRPTRRSHRMTDTTVATADDSPRRRIEDVDEAMRDVVDPELGINVVDLGLRLRRDRRRRPRRSRST